MTFHDKNNHLYSILRHFLKDWFFSERLRILAKGSRDLMTLNCLYDRTSLALRTHCEKVTAKMASPNVTRSQCLDGRVQRLGPSCFMLSCRPVRSMHCVVLCCAVPCCFLCIEFANTVMSTVRYLLVSVLRVPCDVLRYVLCVAYLVVFVALFSTVHNALITAFCLPCELCYIVHRIVWCTAFCVVCSMSLAARM